MEEGSDLFTDHYTKIEGSRQTRTGIIFRPTPHVIHIPKKVQTEEGHLARKFGTDNKEAGCQKTDVATNL